jgi:RHS repeat-associated protein
MKTISSQFRFLFAAVLMLASLAHSSAAQAADSWNMWSDREPTITKAYAQCLAWAMGTTAPYTNGYTNNVKFDGCALGVEPGSGVAAIVARMHGTGDITTPDIGFAYFFFDAGCASPLAWDAGSNLCKDPTTPRKKNAGKPAFPDKGIAEPINAANGNSYSFKTEYQGTGPFPLEFTVAYNSSGSTYNLQGSAPGSPLDNLMGVNRIHNYAISVQTYIAGQALVTRPDGNAETFTQSGSTWVAESNNPATLIQTVDGQGVPTGWEHHCPNGTVEYFRADGLLSKIVNRAGLAQTLTYSATTGLLSSVTDPNGRSLIFSYDTNYLLTRLDLPDGQHLEFTYDSPWIYLANLTSVKYPDGTTVSYLYNESGYVTLNQPLTDYDPHALTGVIDEKGNRYLSTKFLDGGWGKIANINYLGSGVDQYTLSYSSGTATITSPLGETDTRAYQPILGQLKLTSRTRNCSGCTAKTATYTYDAQGRPDVFTDYAGTTTDSDYDAVTGLLAQKIDSANNAATKRTTTFTWNTTLREPTERFIYDNAGVAKTRMQWTYNSRGQVLTQSEVHPITGSALHTTAFTYCESTDVTAGTCPLVGLLTQVLGPITAPDNTSYTYYANDDSTCATAPTTCPHRKGDLWKVTNALGHITTYLTYDGAGRPLTVSDANGVISEFQYSPRGWMTKVIVHGLVDNSSSDDAITAVDYEATGTVSKVTQPDGDFLSYTYDAAHRLTDVTDNFGNSIHYTLDVAGNRTKEDTKDPGSVLKHTQSRVFDQLGRLQKTLNAASQATLITYDVNDNVDLVSDPLNHTANQDVDALNRPTQTTQDVGGLNVLTKYQYDARDDLTQVTDPKNLNTVYTYNGYNDLTTVVSPDTGTTTYVYDNAHNRTSQVDARNVTTNYAYDLLYRLSSVTYPATSALNVTYTYDTVNAACLSGESYAKGHLTKFTDSTGNTQFCYDRFGNLTRKVQLNGAITQTTLFEYTLGGRLLSVTYPSGAKATYGRNADGQVTSVQLTINGVTSTLVSSVGYYPYGPISQLTFGNARVLTRTFDQDYAPTAINDPGSDSIHAGLNLILTPDAIDNISSLVSTLNGAPTTRNYSYDGLNRLKVATTPNTPSLDENFTYDGTGNRLSKQIGTAGAQAYVYPSTSHKLTSIAGGTARTYDADGNILTEGAGSGALAFTYDDRGRVVENKIAGVVNRDFKYNARGERLAKIDPTNSANNVNFVYDESGHLLGDYNNTGGTLHEYVWLDDTLVGVIAASDGSTSKFEYVETDQAGTPRAVIDPVRNVAIWRWSVTGSTFGDHVPDQDADANGVTWGFQLRYPGQYYDGGSGLPYYNYFRDYESGTGRYVESDPIGLNGGISTYGYVGGNPLIETDSFGLDGSNFYNPTYHSDQVMAGPKLTNCESNSMMKFGLGFVPVLGIGASFIEVEPDVPNTTQPSTFVDSPVPGAAAGLADVTAQGAKFYARSANAADNLAIKAIIKKGGSRVGKAVGARVAAIAGRKMLVSGAELGGRAFGLLGGLLGIPDFIDDMSKCGCSK